MPPMWDSLDCQSLGSHFQRVRRGPASPSARTQCEGGQPPSLSCSREVQARAAPGPRRVLGSDGLHLALGTASRGGCGAGPRPCRRERAGTRAPRLATTGIAGPATRKGSGGGGGSAPTMFGRRANVTRRPERVGGHGAGTRVPTPPPPARAPGPQGDVGPRACPQGATHSPRRLPAPTSPAP
jgi:hypothetical protein